jgi:hypothetical protein
MGGTISNLIMDPMQLPPADDVKIDGIWPTLVAFEQIATAISQPEFAHTVRSECVRDGFARRRSSLTMHRMMRQFTPIGPELKTDTYLLLAILGAVVQLAPTDQIVAAVRFAHENMFVHNTTAHQDFLKKCRRLSAQRDGLAVLLPRLTLLDKANRNLRACERLDAKMTTPIEVEYGAIMSALTSTARDTTSFHAMWIGVQLATGCRMTEVVATSVSWAAVTTDELATLSAHVGTSDRERYIKQIGTIKVASSGVLIRPLIGPMGCDFYLEAIAHVRRCVHGDNEISNTRINTTHHSKLNELVDQLFTPQRLQAIDAGLSFGTHFLRACWVNVLYHDNRDRSGAPSMTKFIQNCLGHTSSTSARHYEAVRLVVGRGVPHDHDVERQMRITDDTQNPTPRIKRRRIGRVARGDTPF